MYFPETLRTKSRHEELMDDAARWRERDTIKAIEQNRTPTMSRLGRILEALGLHLQERSGTLNRQELTSADSGDPAHSTV